MTWMYVNAFAHSSFPFLSFHFFPSHFISYNVAISEILSPLQISFYFLEILSPLQISFYFSWDSLPLANLIFKWPHLGFLSLFNFPSHNFTSTTHFSHECNILIDALCVHFMNARWMSMLVSVYVHHVLLCMDCTSQVPISIISHHTTFYLIISIWYHLKWFTILNISSFIHFPLCTYIYIQ